MSSSEIWFRKLDKRDGFISEYNYNKDLQRFKSNTLLLNIGNFITPQPLRAVRVLFSPMVSVWAGGRREKVCISAVS